MPRRIMTCAKCEINMFDAEAGRCKELGKTRLNCSGPLPQCSVSRKYRILDLTEELSAMRLCDFRKLITNVLKKRAKHGCTFCRVLRRRIRRK